VATLRIGFKTAQANVDWPTLLAIWQLADEMPVFDSGWLFDHFTALGSQGGSSFEGWTLAAALANATRRLQFGHLVLGNTYRDPALLARMASTLDHVAGGRFVLGLGAGWHEAESAMYGWRMPPPGERIGMLESAVKVIRALWDNPDGVTLDAPPYALRNATGLPAPLTPGGPPIVLGTQGPRGLRLAAELADGWNQTGDPDTFAAKHEILLQACAAVGRDPADIEISAQAFLRDGDHAALLAAARRYAKMGVQHVVLVMPAADGPDGLRLLAERVAQPLREEFA
jgi:alkanesulfonate monooxygenase SsuD/methylene tetrahydromethanopterin reductase-like flavin-dependent oxidoreductase (luciferase family)